MFELHSDVRAVYSRRLFSHSSPEGGTFLFKSHLNTWTHSRRICDITTSSSHGSFQSGTYDHNAYKGTWYIYCNNKEQRIVLSPHIRADMEEHLVLMLIIFPRSPQSLRTREAVHLFRCIFRLIRRVFSASSLSAAESYVTRFQDLNHAEQIEPLTFSIDAVLLCCCQERHLGFSLSDESLFCQTLQFPDA